MGNSNFPNGVDSFNDPSANTPMNSGQPHHLIHAIVNDALVTIETALMQQAIPFASTVTPNLSGGNTVVVGPLTANITINAPLNPSSIGTPLVLVFTQDGVGNRTVTWNTVFQTNWQPLPQAYQTSAISLIYQASTGNWLPVASFGGVTAQVIGGTAAHRVTLIELRADTTANWTAANPILAQNELGVESDTGNEKIGDGVTAWNSLSYIGNSSFVKTDGSRNIMGNQTFTNGLTITGGGAQITGNSKVTGTLETTNTIIVDGGGATITGNTIINGNLVVTGSFSSGTVDFPSGIMMDFAGPTANIPPNWLPCDGSAISRTTYPALFSAIGTNWGAGDGSTTFNVPDFRGRATIGSGTGSGLTARTLGQTGGEETHTLSVAEMPSHNHTDSGHNHGNTSTESTYHTHNVHFTNLVVQYTPGSSVGAVPGGSWPLLGAYTDLQSQNNNVLHVHAINNASAIITNTGSGSAHNNMQPYAVVTKIIKT